MFSTGHTYGLNGIGGQMRALNSGVAQMDAALKSYCPETKAWLSQQTDKPSKQYMQALDRLIRRMKTENIWQQLDRMWIFATEYQSNARVSIVNPKGLDAAWPTNITEVNSPLWTAKQGYTGDGTSSYLNSGIYTNNFIKYGQNSGSMGFYIRKINSTSSNGGEFGATTNVTPPTGGGAALTSHWNSSGGFIEINDANFSQALISKGMLSGVRTSSTQNSLYNNGRTILTSTIASSPITTSYELAILAYNHSGTVTDFTNSQLSMAYIGGGNINQLSLYSVFQEFATIIGFAV